MTSEGQGGKVFFIVGTPRGGTTWLADSLIATSQIAVFYESAFFGRHYISPSDDGFYSEQQLIAITRRFLDKSFLQSTVKMSMERWAKLHSQLLCEFGALPRKVTPGAMFQAICNAHRLVEGKAIVGEKTPHHVLYIDRIKRAFPTAKFVVLVREPLGYMLSYKHQGDRKPKAVRLEFERLYHPVICALSYRKVRRAAHAAIQKYGKDIMELEDGELDEESLGSRLSAFLEVDCELVASQAGRNSSFSGTGDRPALGNADILWMWVICGRYFRASPKFHGGISRILLDTVASLLALPAWLWWQVLCRNRRGNAVPQRHLLRYLR